MSHHSLNALHHHVTFWLHKLGKYTSIEYEIVTLKPLERNAWTRSILVNALI